MQSYMQGIDYVQYNRLSKTVFIVKYVYEWIYDIINTY